MDRYWCLLKYLEEGYMQPTWKNWVHLIHRFILFFYADTDRVFSIYIFLGEGSAVNQTYIPRLYSRKRILGWKPILTFLCSFLFWICIQVYSNLSISKSVDTQVTEVIVLTTNHLFLEMEVALWQARCWCLFNVNELMTNW